MSNVRVVATQSEAERLRRQAEDNIDWLLRELAANIIRIVRGAGRPFELLRQMSEVLQIFQKYHDTVGHWPSSDLISKALKVPSSSQELYQRVGSGELREDDFNRWSGDGTIQRMDAIHTICRGAAQILASKLVRQNTQEAAGEHELYQGFQALEDVRKEQRKKAENR
jgi:hypothetical protein